MKIVKRKALMLLSGTLLFTRRQLLRLANTLFKWNMKVHMGIKLTFTKEERLAKHHESMRLIRELAPAICDFADDETEATDEN